MAEHDMPTNRIHHAWDRELEPALTIESGDAMHYDIPMAGAGQVPQDGDYADTSFDFDTLYNLAGPLAMADAHPGDTLQVEVLSLQTGPWGWTTIMPDLGLLPDEFPDGYLRTFDLTRGDTATLVAGVEIPIVPFFGTMGNAPDVAGVHLPFPPHAGGGNIDTRHLTVGSTLWLPVLCDGALFSVGDPHAAQGDGEVCVSAIECSMKASLRFTLLKHTTSVPSFRVPGALTPRTDAAGYHGTMGIADDLMEGARRAVRAMIGWLTDNRGLSREDAYILCSLAGDLKIHEIVDAGMWNVGMTMPLSVFE